MLSWVVVLAAALLQSPVLAALPPPPCLAPPPHQDCNLKVTYAGLGGVACDATVQKDDAAALRTPPEVTVIALAAASDENIMWLLMWDPDVPGNTDPGSGWLHWLQQVRMDSDSSLTPQGTPPMSYFRPTPPPGSGPHRYMLTLLAGPNSELEGVPTGNKRGGFLLCDFMTKNVLTVKASTQFRFEK